MDEVLAETAYGKVRGVREDAARVWRGVPYARAPEGPRRFRPAAPPDPWPGVRDTAAFGPMAVQMPRPPESLLAAASNPGHPQSEDCLSLNVWAPADRSARHPVLVWIHGGSFVWGSGASPWYDGAVFAADGDLVVVTINYRLGPLGFLYLDELGGDAYAGSGNCGVLDAQAALAWVRDNIAGFGGDPGRVTVAGESAGAAIVGCLLTMPTARGLFHRAVLQSGAPVPNVLVRTPEAAAQTTRRVLSTLGLEPAHWRRLLDVPADRLLAAAGDQAAPVLDGHVIVQPFWQSLAGGSAHDVPVLLGTNRDEFNYFAAGQEAMAQLADDAMIAAFERAFAPLAPPVRAHYTAGRHGADLFQGLFRAATDAVFWYPALLTATVQSAHAPVWLYRFDWASRSRPGLGACHALEIPFVFRTLDRQSGRALTGEAPELGALEAQVHAAWTAFVRGQPPGAEGLPSWPGYRTPERATMLLNVESRVEMDCQADERRLWQAVTAS